MLKVLVSTADKTGLVEFLTPIQEKVGLEIYSTGGTYQLLKKQGFNVNEVSVLTNFPEVLDGRVKTLHPYVHMGLLADTDNPEHLKQLKEHQVKPFDMVIGNLYPFEETVLDANSTDQDIIENIDIGGPSFLRASAKNYKSIAVVCSTQDYNWVQEKIVNKNLDLTDRKKLAAKVFSLTSYYDSLIAQQLKTEDFDSEYLNIPLKKKSALRYGENSHQQASWYINPTDKFNLADAVIYQGKELSYNNLLDLDAAVALVKVLDTNSCVAVKHNNPCGVATGFSSSEAVKKTIKSDPKSIFGGILAFNSDVDEATAKQLADLFLECVLAPSFTDEALAVFSKKKNLRILKLESLNTKTETKNLFKSVSGGILQQSQDSYDSKIWITEKFKLTTEQLKAMEFAEKVCGALKSNAIAITFGQQTVGLGMGQVNRVDSVEQALARAIDSQKRIGFSMDQCVLASDAFFPFPDSVEMIAKSGIKWVLQPGGAMQDEAVFAAAEAAGLKMIKTARRHFKH